VRAEELNELFMDDLNNLLGRVESREDLLAHRLFLHRFDELFDDLEMDVGFEQRDADLAETGVHILRGEFALAAEVFEDLLQFIAKIFEHGLPPPF
jgi:hypothetical protein